MYSVLKILFLFIVWDIHRDYSYFLMLPIIDLLNFLQNIREMVYITYNDEEILLNAQEGKPLILELFYFELQDSHTLLEAI